jgi:osmotically-inducible protein OsmY
MKELHMETALLARSAQALEHDVHDALAIDPIIESHEIGIAVEDGVVTLTGSVASVRAAVAAERAVKHVDGVRRIANDLRIRRSNERTDTDIAREALHRLRNNVAVPLSVQAVVRDGYIRLDGTVSGEHQRAAAETAVRDLSGVKGVTNDTLIAERVALAGDAGETVVVRSGGGAGAASGQAPASSGKTRPCSGNCSGRHECAGTR